ncbi:MAG: carboxypeptidase-like regulatory domain-containing protein [Acidobacteriota bacterium]
MAKLFVLLFAVVGLASSQVTSSRLTGTVVDPGGAAVPLAQVKVLNVQTGQTFDTTTNERGEWAVPSISTGTYRVTVTAKGFKSAVVNNVAIEAGVPATVNVTLELGTLTETVEVTGAVEVLQTASATVTSTLVGRQIHELPFVTRNVLELIVTQVGTQTIGTPRTSSINGLPKGSLNITMDGLNIQDNLLRSDDGFFASLQPKTDAIEEVTVTTAAAGAESAGEGAAQVRFITKGGSNDFHGGLFWQHRNSYFNSNYYFNNINGLPRDRLVMNQGGGNLGGPFRRNRAFFFVNLEEFRLPQTYGVGATMPTPEATQGIFFWQDTQSRQIRSVNLYELAGARNQALPAGIRAFPTTPDPMVSAALDAYLKLATPQTGSLRDRIATNNDYNRNNFNFQTPGQNTRRFFTTRLDFDLTARHHFETVYNYQFYNSNPDGVNGIYPVLPGAGTVLGHPDSGGIRRNAFSIVGALRSTLSPRLTSELRFGMSGGGNSLFREQIVPALFTQWRGYAPTLNYVQSPFRASGQSRRHTPVWTGNTNLTWARPSHLLNFGGSFTQVDSWQQSIGSQVVPGISFAMAANDPANTGSTSLFDTVNFPNSTPGNRSDAAALYAMLTGRVSAITRSVSLDEKERRYAHIGSVDRNRQREMAFYLQDSWRARQGLTLNYGLRWDVQFPFTNLNGTYTRVGYEGVWGLSGVGNLFKPGVMTGKEPQFFQAEPGQHAYQTFYKNVSPSLGFAWVIPKTDVPVFSWLAGASGQSVLRGGYSISTIREGMNVPINIWGSNQGRTVSTSVNPANFPDVFGAPGSVWFRDPNLPTRPEPDRPTYPIPVVAGNSINDFDPGLRMGYVQSWNLSLQRELTPSTVLDLRYVGNHGTRLWRQINLNEVNTFENGFLEEFKIAQSNLAIARRQNPASVNFGNQGLAGQRPIPIIQTALGLVSDTGFATNLQRGEAGSLANAIAFNQTRMNRLTAAGYPANFFVANPTVVGGGAYLVTNGGNSTYNALQIEVRRRMSSGVLAQGSYVWSKSLSNMLASSSVVFSQPTTLRSSAIDKGASPWDIRHAFKLNFICELPFGPRRRFLPDLRNPLARKLLEGWEIAGVSRMQSGSPELLTGRATFNQYDGGVVLHNLTARQLQEMVKLRKTTAPNGLGVVYFLPQELIDNSRAAWEVGGRTLTDLDPNKPYVGSQTEAGQLGYRVYFWGPWQVRWDLSVAKQTLIGEGKSIELRAQFLNAFNNANFLLGGAGNEVNTSGIGSGFGQTTSAYRDFTVSGTNDPGGRLIEFVLRFRF